MSSIFDNEVLQMNFVPFCIPKVYYVDITDLTVNKFIIIKTKLKKIIKKCLCVYKCTYKWGK